MKNNIVEAVQMNDWMSGLLTYCNWDLFYFKSVSSDAVKQMLNEE